MSKRRKKLDSKSEAASSLPFKLQESRELRDNILSFASVKDLCTWDLVSRSFFFEKWTEPQWNRLSMAKFGLGNGKEGWKLGVSLTTREPMLIELHDNGDFGFGHAYAGSAAVACNDSIVVGVHDDIHGAADDRTFPVEGKSQLGVRDAFSFNYIQTVASPMPSNWNVTICGPRDSEVIVTANGRSVAAHRGSRSQMLAVSDYDERANPSGSSLLILGCETHLILVAFEKVFVFDVGQDNALLSFKSKVPIGGQASPEKIFWAPKTPSNSNEFVFCTKDNHVRFWKLDTASSTAVQTRDFDPVLDNLRTAIATERYIVATCFDRKLHVYDRDSGEKRHTLTDVEEELDEMSEEQQI